MINTTFVGQAQGEIRQKLQKLEEFTGMNASQLLEVATKVFVNRDQEARWEADRKMKRKVDLLAAALAGQSCPGELIQAEAETISEDNDKCPQDTPTLGRNWVKPMCLLSSGRTLEE
jgi:hypothetical protein